MSASPVSGSTPPHHVVIVGGGFGGLTAAQSLRHAPVRITLLDRRNFHLFQPLLYQVATGNLFTLTAADALEDMTATASNAVAMSNTDFFIQPPYVDRTRFEGKRVRRAEAATKPDTSMRTRGSARATTAPYDFTRSVR